LSHEDVLEVLDMYMTILQTGYLYNHSMATMTAPKVQKLHKNIEKIYPSWPKTQQWVREVFQSVAPKRDTLYFNEVEQVVAEIGERYGQYENVECQQFKDWLVDVEDKSVGGAGRVRISDFYGQALNNGKWQFSESVPYMRELGALDESDVNNPRVIIPNYIQAHSNCISTSAFYSVCCMDECEDILGRLETLISAPEASPTTILSMIPTIASATMPSGRTLSPWMQQRLEEVAKHHDGMVPLHGRLFAQWLHYAFPRECSFPHVAGSTSPVLLDGVKEKAYSATVNKSQMQEICDAAPAQKGLVFGAEAVAEEQSAMWSMQENLVVRRPAKKPVTNQWFSGRACVMVVAVVSMSIALVQHLKPAVKNLQSAKVPSDKYYV